MTRRRPDYSKLPGPVLVGPISVAGEAALLPHPAPPNQWDRRHWTEVEEA